MRVDSIVFLLMLIKFAQATSTMIGKLGALIGK
jgi:hypothetical protein